MIVKYIITIVYSILLAGGVFVGARQIYQGFRKPSELLNPLFANKIAIRLFTVHIVVVSADLFVIGPLAIAHKSPLYYWGGRCLLVTSALPIAAYLNRNPQTFGRFIGRWVAIRNFFEYGIHIAFAVLALSWFRYYVLLWWIVAYRYLDVGPRRLLQRLYNTRKAGRSTVGPVRELADDRGDLHRRILRGLLQADPVRAAAQSPHACLFPGSVGGRRGDRS